MTGGARKKKILVVDDSSTARMIHSELLGPDRFDIVMARDGVEAVAAAGTERPDLILMDLMMPRMNGFEACRAVRANEATKAIPIVIVTTRGETEHVTRGYQAGCNDYVTKPIDGDELVRKVRRLLGDEA